MLNFKHIAWYDSETYSSIDLKLGVHKYIEAKDFEVTVSSFALNDSDVLVVDHTAGETLPRIVTEAARDPEVLWVAHNAPFDRTVTKAAGLFDVPIERWWCTMVQAMLHGLPGGLERLCEIFKLPDELSKIDAGKALVKLFCKPTPKTWKVRRATSATHPQEWAEFLSYAEHDVLAMRALYNKIPKWNFTEHEHSLWCLDQEENDRGILCDLEFVDAAIVAIEKEQKRINARGAAITEGDVDRLTRRDALLKHLAKLYEVNLPDLSSDTIERRLKDEQLPWFVKELLQMRMEVSKSSTTKFKMIRNSAGADGRIRGIVRFSGAPRTRRDAGARVQPQNFLRPPKYLKAVMPQAIEAIRTGDADLFPNVMELCGSTLRGAMIASPGHKLVFADLSNIEGRFTAWVAGEDWKVQAFRDYDAGIGPDLYILSYSRAFHTAIEEVIRDYEAGGDMRQVGKVQELACGYQGAVGAFQSMAALYGVEISDERALEIVKAWRKAHPAIVSLWYTLDACAGEALRNPGMLVHVNGKLAFEKWKAWLLLHLPSGRRLCYPQATIDGNDKISYMGVCPYTKQWRRLNIYGGKFTENIAQSGSRDVFFDALPALRKAGFLGLLRVHDERLAEVPESLGIGAKEMVRILTTPHKWCADLPLAAVGHEAYRYDKA